MFGLTHPSTFGLLVVGPNAALFVRKTETRLEHSEHEWLLYERKKELCLRIEFKISTRELKVGFVSEIGGMRAKQIM